MNMFIRILFTNYIDIQCDIEAFDEGNCSCTFEAEKLINVGRKFEHDFKNSSINFLKTAEKDQILTLKFTKIAISGYADSALLNKLVQN